MDSLKKPEQNRKKEKLLIFNGELYYTLYNITYYNIIYFKGMIYIQQQINN